MIYENGSTTLSNAEDEKIVALSGEYTALPAINATLHDSSLNLNVTIKDITTTGFTIMLSDSPGTGITTTVNYIVFGE
jgi:hypothetical protein